MHSPIIDTELGSSCITDLNNSWMKYTKMGILLWLLPCVQHSVDSQWSVLSWSLAAYIHMDSEKRRAENQLRVGKDLELLVPHHLMERLWWEAWPAEAWGAGFSWACAEQFCQWNSHRAAAWHCRAENQGCESQVQMVLCKGLRGRGQARGRKGVETRVESWRAAVTGRGLQFSIF